MIDELMESVPAVGTVDAGLEGGQGLDAWRLRARFGLISDLSQERRASAEAASSSTGLMIENLIVDTNWQVESSTVQRNW
jgi:hypothetical protein